MKGTFFQTPLEFHLKVEGEAWHQGDEITGSLEIRNHGPAKVSLADARVALAQGELKKVRQKSPEAFKPLSSLVLGSAESAVGPNETVSFPWKFQTDRNCPISDTLGSPFLLYGLGEATEKLGQLQIPVHPATIIEEFLKTLQVGFRFVQKTRKSTKRGVEIKLAPPDSKAFSSLEQLVIDFRFKDEKLEVEYFFHIKKLEATVAAMAVKKEKLDLEQSFTREELYLPSGRVNYDHLEASIREALSHVESKVTF